MLFRTRHEEKYFTMRLVWRKRFLFRATLTPYHCSIEMTGFLFEHRTPKYFIIRHSKFNIKTYLVAKRFLTYFQQIQNILFSAGKWSG